VCSDKHEQNIPLDESLAYFDLAFDKCFEKEDGGVHKVRICEFRESPKTPVTLGKNDLQEKYGLPQYCCATSGQGALRESDFVPGSRYIAYSKRFEDGYRWISSVIGVAGSRPVSPDSSHHSSQ
jgi:hypothetical protein